MTKRSLTAQAIPLLLTVVVFLSLCGILALFIHVLNFFNPSSPIALVIRKRDILVGLTIYLKTSIDFAIFIGNLMHTNPGWKRRISIEVGTAVGNAAGTLIILAIWNFFREVPVLMVIMIFLASLVLLRMAEESLGEVRYIKKHLPTFLQIQVRFLMRLLRTSNTFFSPLIRLISPSANLTGVKRMSFFSLLFFAATVPFILGLDDFAGYIPLFSIINVFGFSIGVFLGHMILNAALFLSPSTTVRIVKHPLIMLIGGVAFIAIAFWGLYEALHLLSSLLPISFHI